MILPETVIYSRDFTSADVMLQCYNVCINTEAYRWEERDRCDVNIDPADVMQRGNQSDQSDLYVST